MRYIIIITILFAVSCGNIYASDDLVSCRGNLYGCPIIRAGAEPVSTANIALFEGMSDDFKPPDVGNAKSDDYDHKSKDSQLLILYVLVLCIIIYFLFIRSYFGKGSITADRDSWGYWHNWWGRGYARHDVDWEHGGSNDWSGRYGGDWRSTVSASGIAEPSKRGGASGSW